MEAWFSEQIDQTFTTFGSSHTWMLFIYLVVSLGILGMHRTLRNSSVLHNMVRFILLFLLILSEISYQTWTIMHGLWMEGSHLPLHLCGVASLLGVVALLTYNPKLIKITFFIGIMPAAIALITPDIPHGYEHFRFWKFFVHHMAISWTSLFLVVSTKVLIRGKDMLETFFYLIIYSVFIYIFNVFFQTNYLYLNGPPIAGTPLDWMGEGVMYYISLVLTAFFVFSLMYFLYKLIKKTR
ncbi:YwaF family protein [Halobacillus faecis]